MPTDKQIEAARVAWANAEANGEDRIDGLWRAALDAADAAGWGPIDTAPKDGAAVLLFSGYWRICVGWYEDDHMIDGNEASGWTDGTVADWGQEWNTRLHPAHWRPLPTPPEVSK